MCSERRKYCAAERLACAACQHQRKKCRQDCIFSLYFPRIMTNQFRAVHKVFGVSNIRKMIRSVKLEDRRRLVDSLVWEAFCRQKYPVDGPYGEYQKILNELQRYKHHGDLVVDQNQIQLNASTPEDIDFDALREYFGWDKKKDGSFDNDQSAWVNYNKGNRGIGCVENLQKTGAVMPMQLQHPSR